MKDSREFSSRVLGIKGEKFKEKLVKQIEIKINGKKEEIMNAVGQGLDCSLEMTIVDGLTVHLSPSNFLRCLGAEEKQLLRASNLEWEHVKVRAYSFRIKWIGVECSVRVNQIDYLPMKIWWWKLFYKRLK